MWSLSESMDANRVQNTGDSSPRMGDGLGRKESWIIILGKLGEVCLYNKRQMSSVSTNSKQVTRLLTKSIVSLLGGKTDIL